MKLTKVLLLVLCLCLLISSLAVAEGKYDKIAFITAQKLGDQGVTDLSYGGFMKAAEEFGLETQVIETQKGEYEESIRAMAETGYDILVVMYTELVDATAKVAPDYPDVKFISILGQLEMDNVKGILGLEHEGSYLAGIEAGMISKTGHIGFIGGQDNAEINRFLAGYEQGALSVNPNIIVDSVYVGSFEDPAKGKDLAEMLYNQGCDIIYAAAAKSGLGMFDAAKESGGLCIGVDLDQNNVLPGQVIGSMTISYDKWIYDAIAETVAGNFTPGIFWYGIEGGNLALTLPSDDLYAVPKEVVEAVNAAIAGVASGAIVVDPVAMKDK
jgi:basic membrane protein A